MSRKGGNPLGDHEYLHSAIVQKRHTEEEHEVVTAADISMHSTRCVMIVRLAAYECVAGKPLHRLCGYEFEWPNANVVSWAGALFNAYVKLDQLVEESRMDVERAFAFKQK